MKEQSSKTLSVVEQEILYPAEKIWRALTQQGVKAGWPQFFAAMERLLGADLGMFDAQEAQR